jgi:hypothetical protein
MTLTYEVTAAQGRAEQTKAQGNIIILERP